jgi:hypothetical protein
MKRLESNVEENELMKCTASLFKSLQDAGGAIDENYLNMKLGDFISTIASKNNIKFIYVDNKIKNNKKQIFEMGE